MVLCGVLRCLQDYILFYCKLNWKIYVSFLQNSKGVMFLEYISWCALLCVAFWALWSTVTLLKNQMCRLRLHVGVSVRRLHGLHTFIPTYTFDLDVVWRYVQRCYPCKYQIASLLRYFAHSSLKHLQAEAKSGPKKLYSDTPGNSTDNTCIYIDYSTEDGIYWYETNL